MVRLRLIPREEKFYDLFEEGASNLVASARLLVDVMEDYQDVPAKVERLSELESKGDTIIHQTMERLHRTFVTPLDREDIALIAESIDDVVDLIEGTASSMLLFRISKPTPHAQRLAGIILTAAGEVQQAVVLLRHSSQLRQILVHCVELNRLENEADHVLREGLVELFDNEVPVIEVLKWRDIYESLERATDRCEDIANVLEGVVLKNA